MQRLSAKVVAELQQKGATPLSGKGCLWQKPLPQATFPTQRGCRFSAGIPRRLSHAESLCITYATHNLVKQKMHVLTVLLAGALIKERFCCLCQGIPMHRAVILIQQPEDACSTSTSSLSERYADSQGKHSRRQYRGSSTHMALCL